MSPACASLCPLSHYVAWLALIITSAVKMETTRTPETLANTNQCTTGLNSKNNKIVTAVRTSNLTNYQFSKPLKPEAWLHHI
jgi:hypothetical protein